MDSKFHDEFAAFEAQPWITLDGGKLAGYVRTAGATELTAGNVTFVTVYDAGYASCYLCVLSLILTPRLRKGTWFRMTSQKLLWYV